MVKILILIDYRGDFQCSIEDLKNYSSMNIPVIETIFKEMGYIVEVKTFSDINFQDDYKGWFVLYHSAEDNNLFYKSYIEDICFYLEKKGSILLPKFECLKAHHNKVFMELLRNSLLLDFNFKSFVFGTYDEFIINSHQIKDYPVIFKLSEGAGSRSVQKADNLIELQKIIKDTIIVKEETNNLKSWLINKKTMIKSIFNKSSSVGARNYTVYRKKFIIQPFYKLTGDCKVLRYGEKYYVLGRKNRKNDFRASGSGNYYFLEDEELQSVLNCAKDITNQFDENLMGLDISYDFKLRKSILIEFQFGIFLGPYTLQVSDGYYKYENETWNYIKTKSNLEKEYCIAINEKIINFCN